MIQSQPTNQHVFLNRVWNIIHPFAYVFVIQSIIKSFLSYLSKNLNLILLDSESLIFVINHFSVLDFRFGKIYYCFSFFSRSLNASLLLTFLLQQVQLQHFYNRFSFNGFYNRFNFNSFYNRFSFNGYNRFNCNSFYNRFSFNSFYNRFSFNSFYNRFGFNSFYNGLNIIGSTSTASFLLKRPRLHFYLHRYCPHFLI